jgi:putative membrane protein insertion efficiency factor
VIKHLTALPRRSVVLLLRAYRVLISPLYGPTCRFYPSCSEYALIAVDRHGVVRGGGLAVWRLLRCNPWNPGGVDLVPSHEGDHTHRPAQPSEPGGEPTVAGNTPAPSPCRRVA